MTHTRRFVTVALLLAGCSRAPESRVTLVEARIDGITCPTCVPPLKGALARQYAGSSVDVDEAKETATVRFTPADRFSAREFRDAVERVRMHVVTFRMEACGTVESTDGGKRITIGTDHFAVRSGRDLPEKASICADGTLDTRTDPATFYVTSFK
jgi:copper chaperone CopZ